MLTNIIMSLNAYIHVDYMMSLNAYMLTTYCMSLMYIISQSFSRLSIQQFSTLKQKFEQFLEAHSEMLR